MKKLIISIVMTILCVVFVSAQSEQAYINFENQSGDAMSINIYQSLCTNLWYILSISLQIAGALVALCNSIFITRKSILLSFKATSVLVKDNNSNTLSDITVAIKERFKQAYTNTFAFIYLAVGYISAIFANKNSENVFITICVVILTILLLLFAYGCIHLLLTCDKVTRNITIDECQKLGIKADRENIPNSDIDKLFQG